jgi:protein-S-isoprenylcysteine O-methyltransferase Ste14
MKSHLLHSRTADVLVNVCMASLWALFALRHIGAFKSTGNATYLLICLSETITASFFILRKAPVTVSDRFVDWLLAIVGTFAPLFLLPSPSGGLNWGGMVLVPGMILQILAVLSLNRSFGLVAAKREIKTGGLYRFVRHPLYASYVLIMTGYLAGNVTWWNVVIGMLTIACHVARIVREERHLAQDGSYVEYMKRVPYRLIPLMY